MTYIPTNVAAILLMLILLDNLLKDTRTPFKQKRLFLVMLGMDIMQAVLYIVCLFLDERQYLGSYTLAVIVNGLMFTINAVVAYVAFLYFYEKCHDGIYFNLSSMWDLDTEKNEGHDTLYLCAISAPALFFIATCILNCFFPIYYTLDKETLVYARGDFYFLIFANVVFYYVMCIAMSLRAYFHGKNYMLFPVVLFSVPLVAAFVVQTLVPKLSLFMLAGSISLTGVYINLQTKEHGIDTLSGFMTRNVLMYDLKHMINNKSSGTRIVGIMADIDSFKQMNDTYGNHMADNAIRASGLILRDATPSEAKIYRYGVNEFVILLEVNSPGDVEAVIARINDFAKQYTKASSTRYALRFLESYVELNRKMHTAKSFIAEMKERNATKQVNS